MNWMPRSTSARALSVMGVLAGLGLGLIASPAGAALVTASNSASTPAVDSVADPTTLTLRQFDTSLGALQSVRLQFDALGVANEVSSICISTGGCPESIAYDYTLSLVDFSMGDIEFLGQSDRKTGTDTCSAPGIGTFCFFVGMPSAHLVGDDTSIAPATLALFAGLGNFSLAFNSTGLPNPRTVASASVTYVYDDGRAGQLPEPGTLAMAGLGLLGLLGTARGRRLRRA